MHSGGLTTRLFRETENPFLDPRALIIAFHVFGGYFLGARIGFALMFYPNPIAVIWPPNGILLAFSLLTPKRHWWLLLLAC
jgi:integral membrane sensor domain MASE1